MFTMCAWVEYAVASLHVILEHNIRTRSKSMMVANRTDNFFTNVLS